MGIIWELFRNYLEHVGLSVLLHAWNYCLNIVNDKYDTKFGYEKILGLRGDRTKNDH